MVNRFSVTEKKTRVNKQEIHSCVSADMRRVIVDVRNH